MASTLTFWSGAYFKFLLVVPSRCTSHLKTLWIPGLLGWEIHKVEPKLLSYAPRKILHAAIDTTRSSSRTRLCGTMGIVSSRIPYQVSGLDSDFSELQVRCCSVIHYRQNDSLVHAPLSQRTSPLGKAGTRLQSVMQIDFPLGFFISDFHLAKSHITPPENMDFVCTLVIHSYMLRTVRVRWSLPCFALPVVNRVFGPTRPDCQVRILELPSIQRR